MNNETTYDTKHKIWSGPAITDEYLKQKGVDYERSVGEHIFERMKINSEKICQITDPDGRTLTHGDALNFGIQIALFLRKLNVTKDDVVGIIAKNSTMTLPITVGCWLNCTPFFSLSTQSDRKLIASLYGLTMPKVVFSDAEEYAELVEGCKLISLSPKIYTIDERVNAVPTLSDVLLFEEDPRNFEPTKLKEGPYQTSIYILTSGTTGLPKCMHMSNRQLLNECRSTPSDITSFTSSLLSWISSPLNILNVLFGGAKHIVTSTSTDAELLFELIPKYRINFLNVHPSLLVQMVKSYHNKPRDLTTVKAIIIGGGMITVPIVQEASKMLTNGSLYMAYGATEYGVVSVNKNFHKPKSVGQLMPGMKVQIVDDFGQNLSVCEVGELLVHNGLLWRGYLGNAKETEAMLNAGSWFLSGDLGYFDENGDLYIVDRKKDTLKFHGSTYTPGEIEQVIAQLPDVIEVCVFGVHDDVDGDRATAAVIKRNDSELSGMEIEKYVAARLPYRKHLHGGVYFVKIFPRTSSGKVKRRALRDEITQVVENSREFPSRL